MSATSSPSPMEFRLTRGVRLGCYALCWLPALAFFFFYVPKFEPIFRKLDEKGELQATSSCLLTMQDYDRQSFHLLPLLALVELVALDEVLFQLLRPVGLQRILARLWFAFLCLAGLCTCGMLLFATLQPVFKMSSTIS